MSAGREQFLQGRKQNSYYKYEMTLQTIIPGCYGHSWLISFVWHSNNTHELLALINMKCLTSLSCDGTRK